MLARTIAVAAAAVLVASPLGRWGTPAASTHAEVVSFDAAAPGVRATTGPGPPASSLGTYAWPVTGEVVRPFAAPEGPYGA